VNAVVVEILSGGWQSHEASTVLKSNPQKRWKIVFSSIDAKTDFV